MRDLPSLQFCLAISLLLAIFPGYAPAQEVVTTSAEPESSPDSQARQVERIRQMVHSFGHKASAPAQLVQLTRDLEPTVASGLFLQIAEDYLHAGHCDLAANVLLQLLEQFPDEPVAADATLLLIQLYCSSEVAHTQRQTLNPARQLRLPPGWRMQSATTKDTVDKNASRTTGMLEYALYVANSQLQQHPELAKNSPFAFQCAVAARLSGRSQESKSWLTLLKHKRESAGWRTRALAETWLADSSDREAPLPTTHCLPTDKPPYLDGILNEPIWQTAERLSPNSEIKKLKSEIFFAYDAEFCYVAVRCQRIVGAQYQKDNQPRTYDADLGGHDHLVIRLDTDRDYATYFELAVDHRGQTADTCWLDTSWNPRWFVAAGGRTRSWTIEAAIPWSELTSIPPQKGDVWAIRTARLTPEEPVSNVCNSSQDFALLIYD